MSAKLTGIVLVITFVLISGAEDDANANQLIEKVRSGLKADAAQSLSGLTGHLARDLHGACNSIFTAIAKIEPPHQCAEDCEVEIKKYSDELYSEIDGYRLVLEKLIDIKYRRPLPEGMLLTTCLQIAITAKYKYVSYGVGLALARSEKYGARFVGGVWAFTCLALGKGIAQSKKTAKFLLYDLIQHKETDTETRASLIKLVRSLHPPLTSPE